MHARHLIALALAACGTTIQCSRSALDTSRTGGDGDAACTSPSGVRLCGGPCPMPADCRGYGCTDVLDFDGSVSEIGVCWADTPEAEFPCDACSAGDACLQRRQGEWICVPVDVCVTIWDLGIENVCRYADKSRFDNRAVPDGSGCPPRSTVHFDYSACGGDCGPCPSGGRCNGVSPNHPFGLCNAGIGGTSGYDPSLSCGTTPMCAGINVCAVLDVPAEDLSIAKRYGVCMDQDNCFDFASRFPGGLGCYDAAGNRLK